MSLSFDSKINNTILLQNNEPVLGRIEKSYRMAVDREMHEKLFKRVQET